MISLQVIGSEPSVKKVEYVIKQTFPMLKAEYYYHNHFSETPQIIKAIDELADIFLFVGQIAYNLNKDYLSQKKVFHKYIAPCKSSLLRALFEAKVRGFELNSISLDSYSARDIEYLQKDLNNAHGPIAVHQIEDDLYGIQQDKITSEHINNFITNKASCCFTTMYATHKKLTQLNIPNILIGHSVAKIEEAIHSAMMEYSFNQEMRREKPVVLNIRIDNYDEHSIYKYDDYQHSIHIAKISAHIYKFAKQLNAAVIKSTQDEFWLFTNDRTLRSITNDFKNIDLLRNIYNSATHTVSMGIGYAKDTMEAKIAANKAMHKAIFMGGNKAIICKNNQFLTPLENSSYTNEGIVDSDIISIAQTSGITINQAVKLIAVLQMAPDKSFTSSELTTLMGYNIRTLNRLLERLELAGYCQIVGKKVLSGAGRPSRIIKFNLDKFIF